MEIFKPEEMDNSRHLRVGWYADNGVGKTTLAATMNCRTLIVTTGTEPGTKVITKTGKKNFRIAVLRQWKDLGEVFDMLRRGLADPKVASGERSFYEAVVFDTWTRVQALAQAQVTGQEMLSPEEMLKYIQTPPKLPRGFDAWQSIGALSSTWMRNFNTLPIHVVYLFQEMTKRPQFDTDIIETMPALTPSALVTAKESLELLGRLYVADEDDEDGEGANKSASDMRIINPNAKRERRLLIGKHDRYFAKGPEDQLGYVLADPTWDKIAGPMLASAN